MSGAAGYYASKRASSEVCGRVEHDAAFALRTPSRHLGVSLSCHYAWSVNYQAEEERD